MGIKIALVGNPNSGKTSMYNALTGSNQYVGNWPGVTVEKKEGKLKGFKDVIITDLPGIYSLSPYSLEEVITRDYLLTDDIDVIINIVDATNIERNLYLSTQILEINKPVIIALNLIDVVEKRGDKINVEELSKSLGCPVIVTSATKNIGLKELASIAVSLASTSRDAMKFGYSFSTIKALENIKELIKDDNHFNAIHILDMDESLINKLNLKENDNFNSIIKKYEEDTKTDSQSSIVEERYKVIEKITSKCIKKSNKKTITEKIDKVFTDRILALPIFILIMFLVYFISIVTVGDLTISWMETLFNDVIGENVRSFLQHEIPIWLVGLIVDGLIGGLGSVLVFVPQLIILFACLTLLEDSGYMSRVAFIMDRLFRKFGLSGKSFIPMLIGTGCSVPGIMASRTIENDKDRRMTILLTPFVPCGAKLPVFALFIGAFFFEGYLGPIAAVSMYLLGMAMVVICGIILKKTKYFKGEKNTFVLELPEYRLPNLNNLLSHIWERVRSFLVKAGTVIFVACGAIWFLQSFSWQLEFVEAEYSIMASIGRFIAPIFTPLGFGNWQSTVAILSGTVAKENVVATFGILFGDDNLSGQLNNYFTVVSAYSFMSFILLSAPCFAAIGATKRELGSWKRTIATITFQTGVAYIVALIIYQVGTLISNYKGSFLTIVLGGAVFVLLLMAIIASFKKEGCHSTCSNCKSSCDDLKKRNKE